MLLHIADDVHADDDQADHDREGTRIAPAERRRFSGGVSQLALITAAQSRSSSLIGTHASAAWVPRSRGPTRDKADCSDSEWAFDSPPHASLMRGE